MPYMKKIETTVGQDNLISGGTPLANLGCKFRDRKYLLRDSSQSALHDGAQKFSAGYSGRAPFHHHDAACVIGQPGG
jgi:hypothetical protein